MFRLIIILFLLPLSVFAQEEPDSTEIISPARPDLIGEIQQSSIEGGKVLITADRPVNNLLEWHIRLNERKKAFMGYRIQIYSANSYGCDLEQLKNMRNQFEEAFPDIPAYLKYFGPDFKIRVGNFRSRLECIPALQRIRKLYPSSYPVKTEILLEELNRIPMQDIPLPELPEEGEEEDE